MQPLDQVLLLVLLVSMQPLDQVLLLVVESMV
jgi:hypothetical protein